MAKNAIPGLKTGGGMLTKVVGAAVLIALLVLIVKYPGDAATWLKAGFGFASNAIDGLVTFFRSLG